MIYYIETNQIASEWLKLQLKQWLLETVLPATSWSMTAIVYFKNGKQTQNLRLEKEDYSQQNKKRGLRNQFHTSLANQQLILNQEHRLVGNNNLMFSMWIWRANAAMLRNFNTSLVLRARARCTSQLKRNMYFAFTRKSTRSWKHIVA